MVTIDDGYSQSTWGKLWMNRMGELVDEIGPGMEQFLSHLYISQWLLAQAAYSTQSRTLGLGK